MITLKDGYTKKEHAYEYLTFDEVKQIGSNSHILFVANNGLVRRAKVTSVKTWKRHPNNICVHLKYGLYEYGYVNYVDGVAKFNPLVKEVQNAN